MIKIGSHVSISGGLIESAKEAVSYGANTFMIYTGAPQNTKRKSLKDMKIEEGKIYMKQHNINEIVVHAPYIINLASYKKNIFELATTFLEKEINRAEIIGAEYIVLHPGAYTDKNLEYGINRIAEGLNTVLEKDIKPYICLETMSGKGTEIGSKFEELKQIADKIEKKDKIAICFDTCHVNDAGYDIVNELDQVMNEFDDILGLNMLKVFHINGSLNSKGSKKDRHANIGADESNPKGKDHIGKEAIYNLVHSKYAENKIFILETPWIDSNTNLYKQEIEFLRS